MEASLDVPAQSETGLCCQATVIGYIPSYGYIYTQIWVYIYPVMGIQI